MEWKPPITLQTSEIGIFLWRFNFSTRVPQVKLSVSVKLEINWGKVKTTVRLWSGWYFVNFKFRSSECWWEWCGWQLQVTSSDQLLTRLVLPYMAISVSSLTYKYQINQERCHTVTLSNQIKILPLIYCGTVVAVPRNINIILKIKEFLSTLMNLKLSRYLQNYKARNIFIPIFFLFVNPRAG